MSIPAIVYLGAYEEQNTFSSADFLNKVVAHFARKGIAVECVQTDNGFEFTNRFSNSQRNLETLFGGNGQTVGHTAQAHPSLYSPSQWKGGT